MHEAQKLAAAVVSTLPKEGGFGRDCVHNRHTINHDSLRSAEKSSQAATCALSSVRR